MLAKCNKVMIKLTSYPRVTAYKDYWLYGGGGAYTKTVYQANAALLTVLFV